MEKKLIKIFKKAEYKSDEVLKSNIWHNILLYEKRITRIKLFSFCIIGLASLLGLIPAWKELSQDLTKSGLYEYFSLIFSNSSLIFSYGKELLLSIAESLPTMSIALSLSLIFIFLISLKLAIKQIIKPIRLDDHINGSQLSLSF